MSYHSDLATAIDCSEEVGWQACQQLPTLSDSGFPELVMLVLAGIIIVGAAWRHFLG